MKILVIVLSAIFFTFLSYDILNIYLGYSLKDEEKNVALVLVETELADPEVSHLANQTIPYASTPFGIWLVSLTLVSMCIFVKAFLIIRKKRNRETAENDKKILNQYVEHPLVTFSPPPENEYQTFNVMKVEISDNIRNLLIDSRGDCGSLIPAPREESVSIADQIIVCSNLDSSSKETKMDFLDLPAITHGTLPSILPDMSPTVQNRSSLVRNEINSAVLNEITPTVLNKSATVLNRSATILSRSATVLNQSATILNETVTFSNESLTSPKESVTVPVETETDNERETDSSEAITVPNNTPDPVSSGSTVIVNESFSYVNEIREERIAVLNETENMLKESITALNETVTVLNEPHGACPDPEPLSEEKMIDLSMTSEAVELSGPITLVSVSPAASQEDLPLEREQTDYIVTKRDIENFEERLAAVEKSLKQSEEQTREWNLRISLAEAELIDVHAQIYTIISKLDEEEKHSQKYLLITQSEDGGMSPKEENEANHVIIHSSQVEPSIAHLDQIMIPKEINDRGEMLKNEVRKKTFSAKKELEASLEKLERLVKGKSIGLVAQIPSEEIKTVSPSQRRVEPRVPPHILPPYKRSAFTETDRQVSKSNTSGVRKAPSSRRKKC